MTMRARDKRVTCMRPFVLKGLEGVDPENPILVESRPLIEVLSRGMRGPAGGMSRTVSAGTVEQRRVR